MLLEKSASSVHNRGQDVSHTPLEIEYISNTNLNLSLPEAISPKLKASYFFNSFHVCHQWFDKTWAESIENLLGCGEGLDMVINGIYS